MFKTLEAVFYRDLKPRGAAELFLDCCEFFERFHELIPEKARVKRVHYMTMMQ